MTLEQQQSESPLRTPGDALLWLIRIAWRHRLVVFTATVLGGGASVGLSFLVRPVYRADAIAAYVSERPADALGAIAGELGGLAALAGVSDGLSQGRDNVLTFLSSRELGRAFIETHGLGAILLEESDNVAGTVPVVDWRRAYRVFDRQVRQVTPDRRSGAIRVSMQWSDAAAATRWANEYVALANRELRARALAEIEARLRFLNEQLTSAQKLEVRDAVARVIEGEMRTAMIASSRPDFALQVIDPAVEPLDFERSKPRRGVYGALGALLGMSAALAVLLLRRSRDS
jgi:LPS O-antigen subunit length determinant protein (WzzB/FepE family)